MASPDQLRAARALLGKSQPEVAIAAGVSTMTLKRAEGSGQPPASREAIAAIRAALETAGVIFVEENGEGPGVRLKKPAEAKPVRIERQDFSDYIGKRVRLHETIGTLQRGGIQATAPTGETGFEIVPEGGGPRQSVGDHVFVAPEKFRVKSRSKKPE